MAEARTLSIKGKKIIKNLDRFFKRLDASKGGFRSVIKIGNIHKFEEALDPQFLSIEVNTDYAKQLCEKRSSRASLLTVGFVDEALGIGHLTENTLYCTFEIKDKMTHADLTTLVHELVHQTELRNNVQSTYEYKNYTAFKEKNSYYVQNSYELLNMLDKLEDRLKRFDFSEPSDPEAAKLQDLGQFLEIADRFQELEWGLGPTSNCKGLKGEAVKSWRCDLGEIENLLGIDIQFKNILDLYASGEMGPHLQRLSIVLIERRKFMDAYYKAIREIVKFTELQSYSDEEARDHIEPRIKEIEEAADLQQIKYIEDFFGCKSDTIEEFVTLSRPKAYRPEWYSVK